MAPLEPAALAEVEAAFEATRDAETRLRYQMVLLAAPGPDRPGDRRPDAAVGARRSLRVRAPLPRPAGSAAVPYRPVGRARRRR